MRIFGRKQEKIGTHKLGSSEHPRTLMDVEKEIFFGNNPKWGVRVQFEDDKQTFRRKLLIRNLGITEARLVFNNMPYVDRGFVGPLPNSLTQGKNFKDSGILDGIVDFPWIEYKPELRDKPESYAVLGGHVVLVSPDSSSVGMSVVDTKTIVNIEADLVAAGLVVPQK